jgi:hypothetical protein
MEDFPNSAKEAQTSKKLPAIETEVSETETIPDSINLSAEHIGRIVERLAKPAGIKVEAKPEQPEVPETQTSPSLERAKFKRKVEELLKSIEASQPEARAEQNMEEEVPMERIYELRHEVKDADLQQDSTQTLADDDDDDSDLFEIPVMPQKITIGAWVSSVLTGAKLKFISLPASYQGAVKGGFWAALVILALLLILTLFT